MKRDKQWLENKIEKLANWFETHCPEHHQYKLKQFNQAFYIRKLTELEENNLKTIKI